jgi:hypothetical protein
MQLRISQHKHQQPLYSTPFVISLLTSPIGVIDILSIFLRIWPIDIDKQKKKISIAQHCCWGKTLRGAAGELFGGKILSREDLCKGVQNSIFSKRPEHES